MTKHILSQNQELTREKNELVEQTEILQWENSNINQQLDSARKNIERKEKQLEELADQIQNLETDCSQKELQNSMMQNKYRNSIRASETAAISPNYKLDVIEENYEDDAPVFVDKPKHNRNYSTIQKPQSLSKGIKFLN